MKVLNVQLSQRKKKKVVLQLNGKSVLLIYHLYKSFHMDAVIMAFVACPLVTVNDFHHFA